MFDEKMFSRARMLSKSIRDKKKKAMNADIGLVDTDSRPNMDPLDIHDMSKRSQIEETVGSPEKIDGDENAMEHPYEQDAMSHEPMASKNNPKDHGRMAYGGEVMEHADPMMPSMGSEEEIGGSSGTRSEMDQRIGEGFPSAGKGAGQVDMASEEERRTQMRKMRLAAYMDSLDI